eukprot:CAMPEP_0204920040 /NCGR_PEP_ID=MMETSP1397-20131031/17151_1 /ASSEMBLY_ACC=CAM_ASM_000891 /TAXON_ID=49980 /ORGANISM="Climacostomum Climacostomum virens, Strain Stock W-24" /LENGTH=76 /DNA_ID=CAMNT_0052093693 /DNA_START=1248 /DNA_END=1481 /DNA_ORIENTATION=-
MEGRKSKLERFIFRNNLDKRLYRFVGGLFLLKTAYMLATEGAVLVAMDEELLEESQKLQDQANRDFKETLAASRAT